MQSPEVKPLDKPVEFTETTMQKAARRRRYVMMFFIALFLCGGGYFLFRGCIPTSTTSAVSLVTPTLGKVVREVTRPPVTIEKLITVVVERVVTNVPTVTLSPTQTPHIIYKSVERPTLAPYPTYTPFPQVNGIYFQDGCLVVSIWNVREVYVNKSPAVGGQRYCDVKDFRVVVK